jgi:hypothetical protein
MMEKITSGDVNGSSSCIAGVSVKTRRPQKPSASDTPEVCSTVLDTSLNFFNFVEQAGVTVMD